MGSSGRPAGAEEQGTEEMPGGPDEIGPAAMEAEMGIAYPAGGAPSGSWSKTGESPASRLADALAFWAVVAFGLTLLFASSWLPAARNLTSLREQEALLLEEISLLDRENRKLESRLEGLYNDPYYLERVLRREHGFSGEGEVPIH